MSIYGSLRAGVSGLFTQAQAMGMVSDNIANVNTPGYKRASARFASFVINQDSQSHYTPGGATVGNVRENAEQGLLASAKSPSDLAISGSGFFAVTDKLNLNEQTGEWETVGQISYTRSGQFRPDRYGNLRNAEGKYLMAWPRDYTGAASLEDNANYVESNRIDSLRGVNVAKATYAPVQTSIVDMGVNLNANTAVTPAANVPTLTPENKDYELSYNVIDKQGKQDTMTLRFVKTGVNEWQVHALNDNFQFLEGVTGWDRQIRGAGAPAEAGIISTGAVSPAGGGRGTGTDAADRFHFATLTFASDGKLESVAAVGTRAEADAAANGVLTVFLDTDGDTGAASFTDRLAVDIDFGTIGNSDGFSHFAATSSTPKYIDQNGKAFSSLTGVSFAENGVMSATFANGESRALYKVPLATFSSPEGLRARSGNTFLETEQSGQSLLREGTTGGAGAIVGSSVEQSATDLAEEFANMIIYQRAYSANTKVISTADTMLEELIRAKR